MMTTEPGDELMLSFAAIVQKVGERCLDDAKLDDPQGFARAMQLIAAGEGKLRMTIDFAPIAETHLLVINSEDEPLIVLYTLKGRGPAEPYA
jgi:hypothetical protein